MMMPHSDRDLIALRCGISRGGFSAERIFRIKLPNGQVYVGAAPFNYCFHEDGRPLELGEPPPGSKIPGIILARFIQKEGSGMMLVGVPDGEVLTVSEKEITQVPEHVSA